MKKVLKCMGMMALVALAFTSCKKNQEEPKSMFYASTGEVKVESLDEDRAYVDGNSKFHFEQGDVCMVFNIDETTPTNSHAALYGAVGEGVTNVPFYNIGYGEVAEDMLDGYYAFYPGGPGHTITYLANGENKCKFYVAPEQEYRDGMVAKNAWYAAADNYVGTHMMEDAHFFFKPIMGVLALKPYEAEPRKVTSIEIVDNAWMLSGLVELIIPEVDPTEMQALFNQFNPNNAAYMQRLNDYKVRVGYNVTDETITDPVTEITTHYVKGNSMLLTMPEPVQLGTTADDTPVFNIVLRPLACCFGFHAIFTFEDGSVTDVDYSDWTRPIKPNTVSTKKVNLDNPY